MHALLALLHRDRPRRRDGVHGATHLERHRLDSLIVQTVDALNALRSPHLREDPQALGVRAIETMLHGASSARGDGGLAWAGRGQRAPLPREARRTVLLALGAEPDDDGPLLRIDLDASAPTDPEPPAPESHGFGVAIAPGGPRRTSRAAALAAAAVALHPPAAAAERELAREIAEVLSGDDLRPWLPDALEQLRSALESALRGHLPALTATADTWDTSLVLLRRVREALDPVLQAAATLETERWDSHRAAPLAVRERLRPHDGVHLLVAPQDRVLPALGVAGQTFDAAFLDPPYNTGNAERSYADARSGPRWLTAIDGALTDLLPLLGPAGLLFACIDDNEVSRLRLLLQDHALPSLGAVVVKMSELSGVKMTHAGRRLPRLKEYLLVHGRSADAVLNVPRLRKDDTVLRRYTRYYTRLIDNPADPPEAWRLTPVPDAMRREGLDPQDREARAAFCIAHADRAVYRTNNRSIADWRAANPDAPVICTVDVVDGRARIAWDDRELLRLADHLDAPLGDLWMDLSTINLHRELLGLPAYRGGQKPLALLRRVLDMIPATPCSVLDPWAGSGTTGHAVLERRAQGHAARAVLIEVSPHAAKLAAERLRRAAAAFDLAPEVVRVTECP